MELWAGRRVLVASFASCRLCNECHAAWAIAAWIHKPQHTKARNSVSRSAVHVLESTCCSTR